MSKGSLCSANLLVRLQQLISVLPLAGCLFSFSCGDCVRTPSVSSIQPNSAKTGSGGIVLIVNGNDFGRTSTVQWNGTNRMTTFVSDHQLQTNLTAEDLATAMTSTVTVFSPPQSQPITLGSGGSSTGPSSSMTADCVGGTSASASFVIQP